MTLEANDRAIASFTMVGHALVHWFELAIPIFLVVWLAEFDASVSLLGVIVALGYAPFGLGSLPGGVLADRYGTKRLIILCLAGMSLAFGTLAFATSIYSIALSLLLWGIAASVYHPAGLSLISTGVERRGTVFAWHGIAGNVGIALGPFATATLLLVFEWETVALALAVPGVLAVLYGIRVQFDPTGAVDDADTEPSEAEPGFVSKSRVLFASTFVFVFAIVTLVGLFYRGMLTYLPEILSGLPALSGIEPPAGLEELSLGDYFYVGLLLAGMTGQYAGGMLTNRVPVERGLTAIFAALVVLALAFVPISSMGLFVILLYCGVLGFTLFAIEPFYQEAVAVFTPAESRGLSYGYTYLGMFGLGALSISIGGFLLERSEWVFFAALSLIALLGVLTAGRLLLRSSHGPVRSAAGSAAADE